MCTVTLLSTVTISGLTNRMSAIPTTAHLPRKYGQATRSGQIAHCVPVFT